MINKKYDWIVDAYFLDGRWHGASAFQYNIFCRAPSEINILYCVSKSALTDTGDQGQFLRKKSLYVYKLPGILRLLELQFLGLITNSKLYCTYFSPIFSRGGIYVSIHDCLFMDDKKNFSFFYRIVRRLLFQVSVSRSKMFHTISEYSRQRINLWFGRDALGVVTPCGTDIFSKDVEKRIASFERDTSLLHPVKVLYISRLESRKNHRLLCESLSSFDVGTFSLDCVIGNDSQDHSSLISELTSLFSDITIHKNISPDDLRDLVDTSHLAVYPSSGEGFGIPVVETLAAGLPTLVNKNTALAELKIPTRFLMSVQTADDLSRELSRFLSGDIDAPTADEIAEILAEYSWDTCANRFFSEVFGYECSD